MYKGNPHGQGNVKWVSFGHGFEGEAVLRVSLLKNEFQSILDMFFATGSQRELAAH